MKQEITYETMHLSVDCEENDPVDIRCGGPHILGYDFYVDADDADDLMFYIKKTIKSFGQPFMCVKKVGIEYVKIPWTVQMIYDCIKIGYKW